MIGQDVVVTILRKTVQKGSYESAYLFSGPSGVGKTTTGRIFSKSILCDSPTPTGDPCCSCESCLLFQEDKHFSYKELDAASAGGKEDMKKLRDDASFQSLGKKKIILLDECQDISKQGQDALLKQLEECPEHLIYIFCTTDPDKMKDTLRSRCKEFHISRVDSPVIAERLSKICASEGMKYEDTALQAIADRSKGQVRDAINLLQDTAYLGDITLANFETVHKNYDEDMCNIVYNLGTDLVTAINLCKKIIATVSVMDFYTQLLTMISDATKLLYGYDDFLPQKRKLLAKLKDRHGSCLLEFMDYLISREKFVDRIGLQSDIVLLHYKFSSNSFQPRVVEKSAGAVFIPQTEPSQTSNQKEGEKSSPRTHADLAKMSVLDQSRYLREQRKNQKTEQKETEQVRTSWPLPKEEKPGESSFDEEELSPEEFSRLLVGGR